MLPTDLWGSTVAVTILKRVDPSWSHPICETGGDELAASGSQVRDRLENSNHGIFQAKEPFNFGGVLDGFGVGKRKISKFSKYVKL